MMPKFLPTCISIKLTMRAESLSGADLCFLEWLRCLFSCQLILHISSFPIALSIELAVTNYVSHQEQLKQTFPT